MKIKVCMLILYIMLGQLFLFAQKNTEYARIPFEIDEYNQTIIKLHFKDLEFMFGLDTLSFSNALSASGYEKFKVYTGEKRDVAELLRQMYSQAQPHLPSQDIDDLVQRTLSGKRPLFNLDMQHGRYAWNGRQFYLNTAIQQNVDGIISLSFFGDVNNILINYKDKVIEINAPVHRKNANQLYTLGNTSIYYIFGTLDGKKQAFVIAPDVRDNSVRKNPEDATVYSYDDIVEGSNNHTGILREYDTTYQAKIKINGIKGTYRVRKYNDMFFGSDEMSAFLSFCNVLGYPFFKDRCIQFDFEHSTCYIW